VPDAVLALVDHDRGRGRVVTSSGEPVLRQLDEIAGARRMTPKDCRNYAPADDGMGYGWCGARRSRAAIPVVCHSSSSCRIPTARASLSASTRACAASAPSASHSPQELPLIEPIVHPPCEYLHRVTPDLKGL
jgi:hypothetical protein